MKNISQDEVFKVSVLNNNLPSIFGELQVKIEPKIKYLWGKTDIPKFLLSIFHFPKVLSFSCFIPSQCAANIYS